MPMFLVNYDYENETHFAFLVEGQLYNCAEVHGGLPKDSETFIKNVYMYRPIAVLMDHCITTKTMTRKVKSLDATKATNIICVYEEEL